MFGTTGNIGLDVQGFEFGLQPFDGFGDKVFALGAFLVQPFGDLTVEVRLGKAKAQVLQLPLDLPNPQAIGQRRIQQQGLLRHQLRARGFARRVVAQGLQARGQAQNHHTNVMRHRQQHFARAFNLLGNALLGEHPF